MDAARLVKPSDIACIDLTGNFDAPGYVDRHYQGNKSILRLFAQAYSHAAQTLVVEAIPASGSIAVENTEISKYYPKHTMTDLHRISFWKTMITGPEQFNRQRSEDLIGFALLKEDTIDNSAIGKWHVYESVMTKYIHPHNCVPGAALVSVGIGDNKFSCSGFLYCQQNGLNKACAQVALRSLCATILNQDISYKQINDSAGRIAELSDPGKGLSVPQIRNVLNDFGITFTDVDYDQLPQYREVLPYSKLLYAGIESGAGALLGFKFAGPDAHNEKHIIPFFGHTFNQDTWVPQAERAYFKVGENTRYIPSESWLSSYIGHDDNFGSNYCVPRNYILPENVLYVAVLNPPGVAYDGAQAEATAIEYLYSIIPNLSSGDNCWLKRLYDNVLEQKIVLRSLVMNKEKYLAYLGMVKDQDHSSENSDLLQLFSEQLAPIVWVIEISIPEIFSVYKRKLGEIVLNASAQTKDIRDYSPYLFTRLPSKYLFFTGVNNEKIPEFNSRASCLLSPTPLIVANHDMVFG